MDNAPKYKQLKNYIIEHIRSTNLHYNDPISSEVELMEQFNLSRHTVRRAISDLVNEGWLYKRQGKGTFVADPLANQSGHGKMVGVITTYINDYIFPEIIGGIEEVLSSEGYTIVLGNTNNNSEKERIILKNMMNNNLAGLIIEPTKSVLLNPNKDLYEQIQKRGVPLLFIHATYENVEASYIIEDDFLAGYMATKYLTDMGHTKIAGIFKQDDMQGHGRFKGYLKAHQELGLTIDERHILWYTTETADSLINIDNEDKLKVLLKDYTGVVVYNDQISIKLLSILDDFGVKVPSDLSLVSFDNANISETGNVKLTTIAHPKVQLGKEAAIELLELLSDTKMKVHKIMTPELVVRESVKQLK